MLDLSIVKHNTAPQFVHAGLDHNIPNNIPYPYHTSRGQVAPIFIEKN
jgi:hypothetical protein